MTVSDTCLPSTSSRKFELVVSSGSTDSLSVPVVISTTYPVDRGDYFEVLSHDPADVDLTRKPFPVLLQHNPNALPVGVVERLILDNQKLRGTLRFSNNPKSQEIADLVSEGVVRSLSVGYSTSNGVRVGEKDGKPIYQFSWSPFEVSIVSVPADPYSGFNRGKVMNISENINHDAGAESARLSRSQRRRVSNDVEVERERVCEIQSMGKQFARFDGVTEFAQRAIADGTPTDAFREVLICA